jgi:hypothetical protein
VSLFTSSHQTLGGIGFDVSEFLTHDPYDESATSDIHDGPLPPSLDRVRNISSLDLA